MSTLSSVPKVLIAILAYNEQDSLPQVIESLVAVIDRYSFFCVEIILFDDCSTDQSCSIARNYNLKVVSHVITSGNGMYMIPLYLRYANEHNFDFVVQFDGDGQHDASSIHPLLTTIYSGDSDIIIGSRYFKSSLLSFSDQSTYFDRILGSRIISFVLLFITGINITDPTSGFRVYNRTAISSISKSSIYSFDSLSFLCLCNQLKLVISEIAVPMHPRISGVSEFNFLRKIKYLFSLPYSFIYSSLLK